MSEPAAKSRHTGEPRTAIDLDDFERRLREQPVGTEPSSDPLAELARLVGGESDPFKAVFAKAPAGGHLRPVEPVAQDPHAPAYDPNFDAHFDRIAQAAVYRDPYPAAQGHDAAAYDNQSGYLDQGGYYEQDHQAAPAQDHHGLHHEDDPYRQAYGDGYAQPEAYAGQHYHQSGAYDHGQGFAEQGDPNAPWLDPVMMAPPPQDLSSEQRPRSRRAMLLMSAALVVVAGGIGGTLMFRQHAISSGDMPTIMALDGPVKVQPVQTASDAPKLSVSILEKGSSNIADSKVVDSEEQALDLNQAARTARAGAPEAAARVSDGAPVTLAPPPPANNSIFAEPKKVKSVVVRPDGTIVASAPAAPAPAPRPDGLTSLVASTTGIGTTETPRSAPAKAPTRVASASSQGLVDAGAILQVAPPPQNVPPSPPPAAPVRRQVANVAPPTAPAPAPAPAPAAAARGGAFAVQLAATTSGDEARDAASRLGRKFASELGSYKPGVRMYEVGSKSIYRVRVTGLSSEEANSLCAKLKASGGACFVARN